MKVIFLDMDGVLCTQRAHWAYSTGIMMRHLDPVGVKLLERLCKETGAKLVLSSTWRIHYGISAMNTILSIAGFAQVPWHEDWKTPTTNRFSGSRGEEIASWLQSNPVDAYCIIDDDNDMLPEQQPFFVRTNDDDGISWADYQKAEKILTGKWSAKPNA